MAINAAHLNMKPGIIKINRGKLYNANINRSPTSYLENPEEERKQYPDGDTNKDHTIMRFEDASGHELGMLSWFSVHPTSVANTNHLITSDNKGYAAFLFEMLKNNNTIPGKGPFIAGFCMTAAGDAR
jgi:neutral ceramidase